MAKVIVDEMKCIVDTDEEGSDDVYLLTWRGQIPLGDSVVTQTEFTVHGGIDFWDNLDTGETRRGDVTIADYDPRSLYIVQLIEMDFGRDVAGDPRRAYKQILEGQWALALSRTLGQPATLRTAVLTATVRETLRVLNNRAMEFPLGNDDELGPPRRLQLQAASNPAAVEHFTGEGGLYRFTFKVA
ncbi:hypothetical protein ACQPXH_01145 [Nocardia sp. CA-135953]|uniref:hypothetical protein n=1 Tax=Nocardia sp. CA-135953 TaxID=3239978 RepID=UPI003D970895